MTKKQRSAWHQKKSVRNASIGVPKRPTQHQPVRPESVAYYTEPEEVLPVGTILDLANKERPNGRH